MPQIVTVAEVTETQFSQLFDQFEGDLEDVIEAAEDYVMNQIRYNPVSSTKVQIKPVSGDTIFFDHFPVNELTSIEVSFYYQGPWTAITLDNFYRNLEAGYIKTYNLGTANYVRLTYKAGYTEIPAAIKQAVIIKTALLAAPDYEIYGSGDSKEPGLGHYERMIKDLIAPYKRRAIGT